MFEMEEKKFLYLILLQLLCLSSICDGQNYEVLKLYSGEISYTSSESNYKYWKIIVPDNHYVRINVTELKTYNDHCGYGYVEFTVAATGKNTRFCPHDVNKMAIIESKDVNIMYFAAISDPNSFRAVYNIENSICAEPRHFRCDNHYCINKDQVCDGVKNCESGADEKGCENEICAEKNHFRCSHYFCIHQHQVCDGLQDCENGADEKGCENVICAEKNHFRCSLYSCIHQHQVCDGVQDCENGIDEKGCETGVSISRKNSIIWLRGQRSESFGWGENTHRAITALYLAGAVGFRGDNMEEELMAKKLELQTLVALLRNSTDPMSVSDLSMFITALTVICHDTRQFYGYDLLQILEERVTASKASSPGAYLTLCNANWKFSQVQVLSLLRILQMQYEYPFNLDIHAMTVMALSCVRKNSTFFETIQNASKLYNSTAQKFIDGQLQDGSFGNIYTTALVTQALLSSGQENNKLWNLNSTMEFLMKEANSTADILSTSMVLPIFSGTSLLDIANVNCRNLRKQEDDDIPDVKNKLEAKVRIQYSLYVGDEKDVIHTMYMRVPGNSSAYDVMRLTQVVNNNYKFLHRDVSGHMYVYAIAGISNDPEAGKFWILYTGDSHINGKVHYHNKSPDKFILGDGEHLILWYKTADI